MILLLMIMTMMLTMMIRIMKTMMVAVVMVKVVALQMVAMPLIFTAESPTLMMIMMMTQNPHCIQGCAPFSRSSHYFSKVTGCNKSLLT